MPAEKDAAAGATKVATEMTVVLRRSTSDCALRLNFRNQEDGLRTRRRHARSVMTWATARTASRHTEVQQRRAVTRNVPNMAVDSYPGAMTIAGWGSSATRSA
jgi:hypothetical protein